MALPQESLLSRAKKIMDDLGAECDQEETRASEMSNTKCVNCHLNNINFLLETDLWYEGNTSITVFFRLTPNQKIEVNSQLDKKLDLFAKHIRNLTNTSAKIERDYGNTPDESDGYFPSFPDRKNVGTLLLLEYVLGNERHEEEDEYDQGFLDLKLKMADAIHFATTVDKEIKKSELA